MSRRHAFDSFFASSANGGTLVGLQLGTDGGGNIVQWLMGVESSTTEAGILYPPILCAAGECDDFIDLYISDFVAVNLFLDDQFEWDSGVVSTSPEGLPGQWRLNEVQVPEPASLLLLGTAAGGVLLRRMRRRNRSQ